MNSALEHQVFGGRIALASIIVSICVGILVLRLWYLQGIRGNFYRNASENNRTQELRTVAPRGTIYDREGRVLVQNRPSYNIGLMFEFVQNADRILRQLADVTGRDEKLLHDQLALEKAKGRRRFEPKVVLADVPFEDVARVKVKGHVLPGVIVDVTPIRSYPYGETATHLLGYLREIDEVELRSRREAGYRPGDLIGRTGVEEAYEHLLHGESGSVRIEVDAMGNRKRELGMIDDRSGSDLYLTIDLDLQIAAEESLRGEKGAIVALDPRNGEVLALASAPSFDANILSGRVSREEWNQMTMDKRKPLNNRAIASRYPPGSTFKLIMALAGLAEKKVTPATEFYCPGFFEFKGRKYRCHKRSGHGSVNLPLAVTVSCDSYFYQLGIALGVNTIHKYSTLLGLGELTGIDIPGEKSGIIPSEAWKLKARAERWYQGETLSVSIGQGLLDVTPLQMAVATSTIANGGVVYQPMIVKKVVQQGSEEVTEFQPKVVRRSEIPADLFTKVHDYGALVVQDERGTGRRARLPGVNVSGKTGTAQVVSLDKSEASKDFHDHAWFISFAPAESPTIALAIVVENGGHGGSTAAPISQKIMEVYFRKLGVIPESVTVEAPPATPDHSDTEDTADPAVTEEGEEQHAD